MVIKMEMDGDDIPVVAARCSCRKYCTPDSFVDFGTV